MTRGKKKGYHINLYQTFMKSVKEINWKNLFHVTFFDFLFYIFAIAGVFIFAQFLNAQSKLVPKLDMASDFVDLAYIDSITSAAQQFYIVFLVSIILYVLFVVLCWAMFRGMIWSYLMGKEFHLSSLWDYFKLTASWVLGSFVLIIAVALMLKEGAQAPFMILSLLLFFYVNPFIFMIFTKERKVWKSIGDGFGFAFKKIGHYVIPYIVIWLVYLIGLVFIVFKIVSFIPHDKTVEIITLMLTLVFMTWVRLYVLEIFKGLHKA